MESPHFAVTKSVHSVFSVSAVVFGTDVFSLGFFIRAIFKSRGFLDKLEAQCFLSGSIFENKCIVDVVSGASF